MQLTRSADYLLRLLYALAAGEPGVLLRRQDLVAATDVPDGLFPKLVAQLRRAGLLIATQGPTGGYCLAVPPEQITLLDAIEIGMGPVGLNECVFRPSSCRRSSSCAIHQALHDATRQMRESLQGVTFADLVQRGACLVEAVDGLVAE